jgi:hypothetical protein
MLFATLIAAALVTLTVSAHAAGFSLIVRSIMKLHPVLPTRTWPVTRMILLVTWLLILVHGVEIVMWASFYLWAGCLPDVESALYFSGATYTSVGYGDLVLPRPWRMLGPVEALTGVLMCGLSAGLFFALVSKIYQERVAAKAK